MVASFACSSNQVAAYPLDVAADIGHTGRLCSAACTALHLGPFHRLRIDFEVAARWAQLPHRMIGPICC